MLLFSQIAGINLDRLGNLTCWNKRIKINDMLYNQNKFNVIFTDIDNKELNSWIWITDFDS